MNDVQRDDILLKLSQNMSEIKATLKSNNMALYGNGSDSNPGIIGDITNMKKELVTIDKRVQKLETTSEHAGKVFSIISIIVSAITALYVSFFKK